MTAHRKILYLIDDSPFIITRLRTLLQGMEVIGEIRSAASYEAALVLLAEKTPDLILLDIHLGNRSGIELLQYIKERYPQVIVIMLSNQSDTYYRRRCIELGAAQFVDKATEFSQVPAILASYC